MADDLRGFLAEMEAGEGAGGELIRVRREISRDFEMAALVSKLEAEHRVPVLWFEKVRGADFPVVVNCFASRSRIASSLGLPSGALLARFQEALDSPIPPAEVSSAPVQEVVIEGDSVDLSRLPLMRYHDTDAAPYVTAGIVIAKDPDTGAYNLSFNRMMLKDRNRLGDLHDGGQAPERNLQPGGRARRGPAHRGLAGQSSRLGARGVHDRPLPGGGAGRHRRPDEAAPGDGPGAHRGPSRPGPGGDRPRGGDRAFHPGDGGLVRRVSWLRHPPRERQVVRVRAVTHRRDAVYQDLVGGAHREHLVLPTVPMEANLDRAVRGAVPSLKALRIAAPFCLVASIRKGHPGQPKTVALAAFGAELYLKQVIVVDDDIDVSDLSRVLWAMATRCQWSRDTFVIPDAPGSSLDPSAITEGLVDKVGIDATAKPTLESFSPLGRIPAEVLSRMRLEDYLD